LKIEASFVTSAVSANDLPREQLAAIVFVGRSNVGKSSLINALIRQKLARTSVEPGKTRLANVYRVARGGAPAIHLVDLPGYGFARRHKAESAGLPTFDDIAQAVFARDPAALLLIDSRHPGLESDRAAWEWVSGMASDSVVVATKIDKLASGERIRALRQLESVFDSVVVPVSAATGEGMDELWNLIDRLAKPPHRNNNSSSLPRRNQTARPRPLRKK
jgi:GTP-binding protein